MFIDPTPVSCRELTTEEMQSENGGGVFVIVIIACGGKLGAATITLVGGVAIAAIKAIDS